MTKNAAAAILEATGSRFPDKPALVFRDMEISHARLEQASRDFAALLMARGLGPGDRVALRLPDCPALVSAFFGCMLLGAIPVPIGMTLSDADRDFILKDAGAALLATDNPAEQALPEFAAILCDQFGALQPARAEASFRPYAPTPDDPAFMLYTSGSTGRPKGVPHGHGDVLVPSANLVPAILGSMANDVVLSASKLSFSYGLEIQVGMGLACGATVILHPDPPDSTLLPSLIADRRPTVFAATPTVFGMLLRSLDAGMDLSFIRCCISSGEAMPEALHAAWRERTGLEVVEVIGSTETFTSYMAALPGRDTPETLGQAVPGFEIRIAPDANGEAEEIERGRLQVRGPGIAASYWNRPKQAATAMTEEGWLDTGDICERKNGELWHAGRADDRIRTSGQWVAPPQVVYSAG